MWLKCPVNMRVDSIPRPLYFFSLSDSHSLTLPVSRFCSIFPNYSHFDHQIIWSSDHKECYILILEKIRHGTAGPKGNIFGAVPNRRSCPGVQGRAESWRPMNEHRANKVWSGILAETWKWRCIVPVCLGNCCKGWYDVVAFLLLTQGSLRSPKPRRKVNTGPVDFWSLSTMAAGRLLPGRRTFTIVSDRFFNVRTVILVRKTKRAANAGTVFFFEVCLCPQV